MKTTDECVPETERQEQTIDPDRLNVISRIGVCGYIAGFFSFYAMFWGFGLLFWMGSRCFADAVYGNHFQFTDSIIVACSIAALSFSGFLANFRLAPPKRFIREVIAWLVLLYVAFGFHFLAAYLLYGDRIVFHTMVRGFCMRMVDFSILFVYAIVFLAFCFSISLFDRWLRKRFQVKMVKRKKPVKTPRFIGMVNRFIDRYPARIVTESKEYICLTARYVIWCAVVFLLIFELAMAFWFLVSLQGKTRDPAYESSFALDSFEGEKFGSVLLGDVVRKKLAEPIGAIDELMLQSAGNPAKRFMCVCGQKFLGDISAEEANRLAEETCVALQKVIGVELKKVRLGPGDGFRKFVFSDQMYARVKWYNHFFQKGKMLKLEIGLMNMDQWYDSWLNATEVMGYRIGEPIGEDRKPRTPFWKFERVVPQCSRNQIADGFYAVHDVSALKLEDAVKELEEARKAVEELHGIKMFKMVDGDDVKQYDYYGDDVCVSVKLEYLREKQIRYSVLATGDWAQQIHAMPSVDSPVQQSNRHDTLVFVLCMAVFAACGVRLVYLIRRKKKESNENAG